VVIMMLTQEEKDRIREEETYRLEVRSRMGPKTSGEKTASLFGWMFFWPVLAPWSIGKKAATPAVILTLVGLWMIYRAPVVLIGIAGAAAIAFGIIIGLQRLKYLHYDMPSRFPDDGNGTLAGVKPDWVDSVAAAEARRRAKAEARGRAKQQ
jgi:hypothetical protein